MRIVEQRSAYQVSAEAVMKNGYTIPVLLTIETQAPYLIAGLFLRPAVKAVASLESLQTEFSTLGGQVSFMAMNVGGGSIASAINTSERLPVGSTFKLYVLGEIVRAVRQKERKWTDIVRLDSAWRSLPSGRLHTWPHGSPMTLYSLAAMMISESDNTATDALIRLLGPARIASQMSAMGNDRPDINVPFLTTLQAFKLKYADAGLGRQYASAGHDERVQILSRIDSAITRDSIMPTSTPALADSIEWFATVAELCRAMDWLRREAIMQNDMTALDILGINPGVAVGTSWKRVCYKGGSEPGVINMTFMLEHQDGTWYAVSGSWFKSGGGIDEVRFAGLMERAIQLLQK
jgi:beta-lactamase class A